jgi:hypothetical protein
MISYLLFKIRYHIYVGLSKVFEPKRNEYIMFLLGRYPQNFKHGFKAILDSRSLFRYSIGSTCIVIRFSTTKNLDEVQQTLSRVYSGYMDSFFIFESTSRHAKTLDQVHYKHLYDDTVEVRTVESSLNRIQEFIEVLQQMKQQFMRMFKEQEEYQEDVTNEGDTEERITMDDIDPILEKIKESGIESLTEQEKLILKKYTKND